MTHGELFAGISGFGAGFAESGIETLWHVEIDPKCQSVLRRHYPDGFIFSDVCGCGRRNLTPVDIVSFGSPCQDSSVAGRRAGLEGSRSGLFFEAIRIVREINPAFAVWENVPGAFSSNAGRDFAAVLSAFHNIGASDIAWRVLDAQYFGVAQRRRRIFLVADFRGERAAEVLFERTRLCGNPAQGREAGARVAASAQVGADPSGSERAVAYRTSGNWGVMEQGDVTAALNCATDQTQNIVSTPHGIACPLTGNPYGDHEARESLLIAHTLRAEGFDASEDGTGRGTPLVPVAYQQHGSDVGRMGSLRAGHGDVQSGVPFVFEPRVSRNGRGAPSELCPSLTGSAAGIHADAKPHVVIPFDTTQLTSGENRSNPQPGDPCHGLASGAHAPAIAFQPKYFSDRDDQGGAPSEVVQTLTSANAERTDNKNCVAIGGDGQPEGTFEFMRCYGAVRRLTPRECERLQGFPDDWTRYGHDGTELSDSARYRMLGNAVNRNVSAWIGKRLVTA